MSAIGRPINGDLALYTVSELNREVRELLGGHFLTVRVEGEISNLSMPSSGHVYFTLKDSQAQVRCALFRQHWLRSKPLLQDGKLDNGRQVIVNAQVSLYEPRGDYQLVVERVEDAGFGALQRAFLLLKERLAAEGLFDAAHKRAPPGLPSCIGVVTSPTGAALRDILTVLRRRFPAIPVVIYPTAVQGQNAKVEIVKALLAANRRRECDVLILARGGGSLEDLWPFNEEAVARAIHASKIPLISGIGHETDFTIADFVADVRAPTPSAAAERAVPDGLVLLRQFQQSENRLRQAAHKLAMAKQQRLAWVFKRLQQQHPGRRLQSNAQRLDDLEMRMRQAAKLRLQQKQTHLAALSLRFGRFHPQTQLQAVAQRQGHLAQRLRMAMAQALRQAQQRLASNVQTLQAVSPLATLQRGYAIVTATDSGSPLTSTENLQIGMRIQTRLAKGRLLSRIEGLSDDEA